MDDSILSRLREPAESYGADDVGALLADYDGANSLLESANAKIAEITAQVDDLTAQVAILKAQNYDLMMAEPAAPVGGDGGDSGEDGDSADEDGGVSEMLDDNYSDNEKEDK